MFILTTKSRKKEKNETEFVYVMGYEDMDYGYLKRENQWFPFIFVN